MNLHCNDNYSSQILHEQWGPCPATILHLFSLQVEWFIRTSGGTVAFSVQFNIFCIQDSSSNFGPCALFFVTNNSTHMYMYMLKSYNNCASSFRLSNEWVALLMYKQNVQLQTISKIFRHTYTQLQLANKYEGFVQSPELSMLQLVQTYTCYNKHTFLNVQRTCPVSGCT